MNIIIIRLLVQAPFANVFLSPLMHAVFHSPFSALSFGSIAIIINDNNAQQSIFLNYLSKVIKNI